MSFLTAFAKETGFKTKTYKSAFDYVPNNLTRPVEKRYAQTTKSIKKMKKASVGTLAGRLVNAARRY